MTALGAVAIALRRALRTGMLARRRPTEATAATMPEQSTSKLKRMTRPVY